MAVIPVGYAQANFKFIGSAAPNGAEVTLGLNIDDTFPPADYAEALGGYWESTLLEFQVGTITLGSVLVKFGPNDTGPFAEVANGSPGGATGSGTPPNVSLLVRKITATGGRAGRGRMFIPAINEALVDQGGVISPTDVAGYQTQLDAFYDLLNTGEANPVVLHNVGGPLVTPTPITSFQVDSRVATQRRRLRG